MQRKFQFGGKKAPEKGVLKGDGNVYDRQIPVKLNTGEVIYVQSLDNTYLNADSSYSPGDSVQVSRTPVENKATRFKVNKQTLPKKKQFGGGGNAIVEDGELYKDQFGNIQEAEAPLHEDDILVDQQGNTLPVEAGDGGQVVDAQSVASDSYEKVKDGVRPNTMKERVVRFSPKESSSLMSRFPWISVDRAMSPSELIKEAVNQTEVYKRKFDKNYANDQYSQNSKKLNLQQVPTEEEIYDLVVDAQEKKKSASGVDFQSEESQYGGSTYVDRPYNTVAKTRNYAGRQNAPLTESVNVKRAEEKAAKDAQFELNRRRGYSTGTGRTEPVYPEAVLLPGTPAIKGLGKVGNIVVDAVNPVSGVGTPNASFIDDVIKFIRKPKVEETIRSGEEFVENWYSNPEIKRRISARDNYFTTSDIEEGVRKRSIYPRPLTDPNVEKISYKDFDKLAEEKPSYYDEYKDDIYGVSWGTPNETYVKNNPKKPRLVESTKVHEGTHVVHQGGTSFSDKEVRELREPFFKNSLEHDYDVINRNDLFGNDNYLTRPQEIHARMNEMRYRLNLKPEDEFTVKHYNKFLDEDRGNIREMLRHVYDRDKFIKLMNNFYTPAAVVAGGASASAEKKQYGGVPESLDGLHEYPNQPVVVPAGDISMNGIDYPVEAYDANTGDYLETMQPNRNYKFPTNKVLEIPKAQFGNDGTYFPPAYKVKQGDTLSKIADSYGLTLEDLIKANPNIADVNRINVGDSLTIPDVTVKAKGAAVPVDRSAEIAGIEELPEELNVQADDVIPTLDVKAETVRPDATNAVKDVVKNTTLGKLNRRRPINTLLAMTRANRTVNLPYRTEVPNRTLDYNETDATPYLDEIDSAVRQQLQYVNQNTSQGQAIANNIFNASLRQKRQVLNQVNAQNLQNRRGTDNANTQLMNQADMMQERANAQYTSEVYQTLDNLDQRRIQQAQYLDDLEAGSIRQDNDIAMINAKYTNFRIDPATGEIVRINTPIVAPKKAKLGFKMLNC